MKIMKTFIRPWDYAGKVPDVYFSLNLIILEYNLFGIDIWKDAVSVSLLGFSLAIYK